MFDWKTWLYKVLGVLPQAVQDVEDIAGEKDTETKTQLVAQALVDGKTIGDDVAPTEAADIDAATELATALVSMRQAPPIARSPAADPAPVADPGEAATGDEPDPTAADSGTGPEDHGIVRGGLPKS